MKKLIMLLVVVLVLTLSGCGEKEQCYNTDNRTVVDWEIDQAKIVLLELDNGVIVKPVNETCLVVVE